jgi:hypothetical protein
MEERRSYTFTCYGHPNIRATHVKTLEFTKDNDLTERGDCIIGIKANFDLKHLKEFEGKVKLLCELIDPIDNKTLSSEFKCKVNPEFNSDHEIVLRKSFFNSDRTYGFNLNRGASWLDRRMVEILQDPNSVMTVTILEGWAI